MKVLLAFMALATSACAHSKIPRTSIDDTPENRAIIELVDRYKTAMESLDASAVLSLVSPRFYENNANSDDTDDYDFSGLEANLRQEFQKTRALKLDLRVDVVEVDQEAGTAFAELYYQVRAHHEYPAGMQWETSADRTRLRFTKSGDQWMIVGGL